METQTKEPVLKLFVFGTVASGKSCFIRRFIAGMGNPARGPNLGYDVYRTKIQVNDKRVSLKIVGLPGNDKYKKQDFRIRPDCSLLLFDMTSRWSFEIMKLWHSQSVKELSRHNWTMPAVVVGTKEDLMDRAEVGWSEAYTWARQLDVPLMCCSAETGKGVQQAFIRAAELGLRQRQHT